MRPKRSKSLSHNPPPVPDSCRRGFAALLGLLVVVAIMMMLYFVDMSALFGPARPKGSAPPSRPWLEEDRIIGPDKLIEMPEAPKPILDEPFTLKATVTRNEENRGIVTIEFNTAGEVSGAWKCEFADGDRETTIEASFDGNIDVTKTYSDKNGDDPSLLYFITKGDYIQTVYNAKTDRGSVNGGDIYVTGYLAGDYSAAGLITITTDRKWSATYNFDTKH